MFKCIISRIFHEISNHSPSFRFIDSKLAEIFLKKDDFRCCSFFHLSHSFQYLLRVGNRNFQPGVAEILDYFFY